MRIGQGTFLMTLCLFKGALSAEPSFPPGREGRDLPIFKESQEYSPEQKVFTAFTGVVAKNKVRLRAYPSTDSPILKELAQGDFLVIEGEQEEFYAVKPLEDSKGYVFRTFVLEGVIEGNKVNVRLQPDTESPIIAQLNSGDKVEGKISSLNSKWMEIIVPEKVHFYVSKEYIKKVGDKNYMALMQKKRQEVNALLSKANEASQEAYKVGFPHIDYDQIVKQYERIITGYPEFEEHKRKAEGFLSLFKENYIKMKIAHLEANSGSVVHIEKLEEEKHGLQEKMREQQQRLAQLEQQVHSEGLALTSTLTMPLWANTERKLYLAWMEKEGDKPMDLFYQEQRMDGTALRGTIEPYLKKVSNKPGDFILLNQQKRPVAFLYSTLVNLYDLIGKEVVLMGSKRANNDFAFPAYFVLSVE